MPLFVLSDSTGNLARHMVTSFLTQFPPAAFSVHMRPFVSEPDRLSKALADVAAERGIVFHAVVLPKLKDAITRRCRALNVPCCDLTGPAVAFLAKASRIKPVSDQHRLHPVDHTYVDRINAMSFTLEHDDGLGLETLDQADIVLAGVSRTGKTPTSVYLAMLGFRAANVPLAMKASIPAQLLSLPPGKVVGLVINPRQLVEIRTRRQTGWRMQQTSYNDHAEVREELLWSRRVFAQMKCPVLDVTNQAVEETAARVLDLLALHEPAQPASQSELS
jgi:[pyruvate, water dikinase]-phosphate phosphotransferase / [pyruvate, water dikinase] kinase